MSAALALPSRRRWFSSIVRASTVALAIASALPGCKTDGESEPPDKTGETDELDGRALPKPDPLNKALALLEQEQPQQALELIDDALAGEHTKPHELQFARGVALAALGRQDEAARAHEEALKLKPDFFAAHNALGAIALDKQDFDGAIAAFQAALQAKPAFSDAHYNLGRALIAKGDLDGASKALEEALRLAPEDVDALFALAQLEFKRGELDKAIAHAAAAAKLKPEDPAVRFTLGKMLMRAEKFPAAVVEFQLAYEAHPDAPNVRQWLGRSLVAAGRAEDAMPHLEALAAALPEQAIVWVDYADGLAAQGKLDGDDGALAKLDKAFSLDPKLAAGHLRKIEILAKDGRCKPAKRALKEFKKLDPPAAAIELAEAKLALCGK